MRKLSISFGLIAFLFTTPAFADATDTFDQVTGHIEQAGEIINSSCGQEVQDGFKAVRDAIKNSRAICSELRNCKKSARASHRARVKSALAFNCKQACKGRKRNKCMRSCRARKQRKVAASKKRKRAQKRQCRATYKTSDCRAARKAVAKQLFGSVGKLVKNKDCQSKIKDLASKIDKGS